MTDAHPSGARGRRVGFHTFGCKLNQFETEALASSFRLHGFAVVEAGEEADAYVVNTCTVTARADHKARSLIRALARGNPRAILFVTGCSAQVEAGSFAALAPNVVVVPQSEKARFLDLPQALFHALDDREEAPALLRRLVEAGGRSDPFALDVAESSFHTRAFLKIQDGCDCRCAYCRVPQARGPAVSLEPDRVVRRAVALEERGSREIVLTGVNVSSYRSKGIGLDQLVPLILRSTRSVRLRLSSLEPEAVTRALVDVFRDDRICAHFHIPVQSGADAVLARMNRRYRADRIVEGVDLLRAAKPDPFLAADLIAGFPGESAEEFAETCRLVRGLDFAALHVFPFSPRPGTAAAGMKAAVPERTRRERARALADIAREQTAAYQRRWLGREVDVLLEAGSGAVSRGTSGNYLKIAVEGLPQELRRAGELVRVRLTGAKGSLCFARFSGAPA